MNKHFIFICLSSVLISCGNGNNEEKKEEIQEQIDYINARINTLDELIPEQDNPNTRNEMIGNRRNYEIQLDELNRQLVNGNY